MEIVSKFNGRCNKCQGDIIAGTRIEWEKGQGSRHVQCPPQPPTPKAPVIAPGVPTYKISEYRGRVRPENSDQVGHHFRAGKCPVEVANKVVTVIGQKNSYTSQEDAEDMGDGRGGWWSLYTVVLAGPEGVSIVETKEAKLAAERLAKSTREQHRAELYAWNRAEHFTRPARVDAWPNGTQWGGARYDEDAWIVVNDGVWFIRYNGRDGDMWALNNLPSSIAYFCNDFSVVARVKELLVLVYGAPKYEGTKNE